MKKINWLLNSEGWIFGVEQSRNELVVVANNGSNHEIGYTQNEAEAIEVIQQFIANSGAGDIVFP